MARPCFVVYRVLMEWCIILIDWLETTLQEIARIKASVPCMVGLIGERGLEGSGRGRPRKRPLCINFQNCRFSARLTACLSSCWYRHCGYGEVWVFGAPMGAFGTYGARGGKGTLEDIAGPSRSVSWPDTTNRECAIIRKLGRVVLSVDDTFAGFTNT